MIRFSRTKNCDVFFVAEMSCEHLEAAVTVSRLRGRFWPGRPSPSSNGRRVHHTSHSRNSRRAPRCAILPDIIDMLYVIAGAILPRFRSFRAFVGQFRLCFYSRRASLTVQLLQEIFFNPRLGLLTVTYILTSFIYLRSIYRSIWKIIFRCERVLSISSST